MEFPFEGIPTVPPRKDMTHMVHWHSWSQALLQCLSDSSPEIWITVQVFFCSGCRYRVTAFPDWPVAKVCYL